jgi:dipeptidyl aminopeptidase/acylaminoacyl peptidase
MKTIPRVLVAAALALSVLFAPVGGPTLPATAQVPEGAAILAIVGRQVVWLNLESPRHRAISRIQTPANALDVTALPDATGAVVSVSGPFPGGTLRGADLLRLDLESGETQPLLQRAEPSESLHAPAWWPDRTTLLFERQDLAGQPIGPPGQEIPRYPSRIERVYADGSGREVILAEGRQPAPSPDGSRLVFARTRSQGTALLSMSLPDGALEVLVPEGQFSDLAYPQVSPAGDQIAFMAPQSGLLGSSEVFLSRLFEFKQSVALAHGIPWDPWVVNLDGSGLRRVAETAGDEPSVAWSPDASALFVYSGTGSFIIDHAGGAITALPYVQGYGPTVWLSGAF